MLEKLKITKMDIVKYGVGIVASVGTGQLIGYAVNLIVPPTIKPVAKVAVVVATYFIGGMAGETVGEYAVKQIVLVEEFVAAFKEGMNDALKEAMNQKEATTEM